MKLITLVVLIGILSSVSANAAGPTSRLTRVSRTNGERSNSEQKSIRRSRPSAKRQMLIAQQPNKPVNPSSSVGSWRGPACILGGALTHLTLGTLYCWGNFLSYAPAHLRFFDGIDRPGVPPDAMYVIPFTIIAQAISVPLGPSLAKAVGAPRALMLGCWLTAFAVYMSSYQKTLGSFILFYSFLFGTGAGLAYTAPMAAGWKWLPNHKGLVTGGVLASFGAGGFLFSMLGSKHVNPNGINPVSGRFPQEVYDRFPSMLRKLAVMYAVVSFVGSCFVTEPPSVQAVTAPVIPTAPVHRSEGFTGPLSRLPPQVQVPLRRTLDRIPQLVDKLPPPAVHFLTDVVKLPCLTHRQHQRIAQATPAAPSAPSRYSPRGLTVAQALGTRQFWLMWVMIISCATAGLNTASIYKQFAATSVALTGDEFQALVGGIGAIFNGVGRIFWGAISDRIGFKTSFMVLSSLQALSMLVYTQAAQSKGAFALTTCSLFFTLGGSFALIPPAVQRIFGPEAGTVIYGLMYSAFAFASVAGGILTKMLVRSLGWEKVFQTMAAMSFVATGIVTLVKPIEGFAGSVV